MERRQKGSVDNDSVTVIINCVNVPRRLHETPLFAVSGLASLAREVVKLSNMEAAANDWLLAQCEGSGVHYRQNGDAESRCGDRWANHTTARDFVTCKSCLALLRGAVKSCEDPLLDVMATAM